MQDINKSVERHQFPSVTMFDAAYPPPVIGGKEKQAHLLAKSLFQKGVRVQALSYEHNANLSESHEGVFVKRVKKGLLSPFKIAMALISCRKSFSILHIHTPSRIGKLVALFGFLLRYRVVFKFPNEHLLDSTHWFDRLIWRALFTMVDLFVVLEEDTRKKLQSRGITGKQVFCVENGVEMGESIAVNTSKQVRLIFVGRLMPQKACDQLIRACALLRKAGVDFSLCIVGDGPLMNELSGLVDGLELADCITFEGYHPAPIELMKKSDLLVLPSLQEGMSNVLLEAISIGLPIVATDVGSAKKQVGSYGEQFLCKPTDSACLAEKIQLLADDPMLRKEYGAYLYQRGHEMFSIDAVADKYIQAYEELL